MFRIYAIKECQLNPKRCIEQLTKSYRIMILPSINTRKVMGDRLSKIIIPRQLHNNLVSLAKNSLPNESCALLVGKTKGEKVYVVDSIPMKNSDASALTFSIDPQDLINTYQKVEEQGMQVVGIFHSHPAEPLPSQTDKKFMEINPVVWLIYSTITDKYKAYVFEEKIKEVHIHHTMA